MRDFHFILAEFLHKYARMH